MAGSRKDEEVIVGLIVFMEDWQAFLLMGTFVLFLVFFVYTIYNEGFALPGDAKRLRRAKRKKTPIVTSEDDGGHVQHELVEHQYPEGIIKTRVGPKQWRTYFQPRMIAQIILQYIEQNADLFIKENPDFTRESLERELEALQTITEKNSFFKSVGVPHFVGYAGELPVCLVKTLANMTFPHFKVPMKEVEKTIAVAENQKKESDGKGIKAVFLGKPSEDKPHVKFFAWFPVKPKVLGTFIPFMYSQALIHADEQLSEAKGRKEGAKMGKVSTLMLVLPIVTLIVGLALGFFFGWLT